MPTVSIIVPVYKAEAYLSKCVESILAQTFRDFELILIDDGSPDRSGEICERYAEADPRIRVIHRENGGVSRARNSGLEHAKGEYVTFCDSDDTLESRHLEGLLRLLRETESDSAVTGLQYVVVSGTAPEPWPHWEGVAAFPAPEDRIRYIYQKVMSRDVGWEVCTRLFRRTVIEERRIRFCETCDNFAEDLGFVIEYVLGTQKEASSKEHSYRYHLHGGSMMHSSGRIVKLDQVNELSKFVYPTFAQAAAQAKRLRSFTPLHALILYNQASKFLRNPGQLRAAVAAVKDPAWMKKHLHGVLFYRRMLQRCFGKEKAWKVVLLSHYLRYQNRMLYRLERAIINLFFVKIESY